LLLVHGRTVVEQDHLVTVDEDQITRDVRAANGRLLARAGVA